MHVLPKHESLTVETLCQCFDDTTNSYKFYWFLSILDHLQESNDLVINMEDLALRMLANVWYPLDFFKLSFGKIDSFKAIAKKLTSKIPIDNSLNAPSLFTQIEQKLTKQDGQEIISSILSLLRYVPMRFQRPFFKTELRGVPDQKVNRAIVELSNISFAVGIGKTVIYRFLNNNKIEIHPLWKDYLQKHQALLRGFINWHLVKFLHKNNPSVIGLTEKLYKPTTRNLSLAKKFWDSYFKLKGSPKCIYSKELLGTTFSLDHFIPWSYVAHDELWNIIPIPKRVNSSKSNNLPDFGLYLDSFVELQYHAFEAIRQSNLKDKAKLLDSYFILFNQKEEQINFNSFNNCLKDNLFPLLQSAKELGFSDNWQYKT